jgi:hypothetical protein
MGTGSGNDTGRASRPSGPPQPASVHGIHNGTPPAESILISNKQQDQNNGGTGSGSDGPQYSDTNRLMPPPPGRGGHQKTGSVHAHFAVPSTGHGLRSRSGSLSDRIERSEEVCVFAAHVSRIAI